MSHKTYAAFLGLFLGLALSILPARVEAQLDQTGVISTRPITPIATNYFFARPNELTLVVSVVGAVTRPGRYEVGKSVDLLQLLSLAGGPNVGTGSEGSYGDVTLIRPRQMGDATAYDEIHLDLSDPGRLRPSDLALVPGDIIRVERSGWSRGLEWFGILVGLATIVVAVTNVIIVTQD